MTSITSPGSSHLINSPARLCDTAKRLQDIDVPLCVDLDGTLVRSDLLWESVVLLLREKFWLALALPFWLLRGKAAMKRRILEKVDVAVESLPYNDELVEWLKAERKAGRTLVLATASDQLVAERIAKHLALFDAVLSSDGARNLAASNKSQALCARYGNNFDYAGNSRADLPVWKECRKAILVDAAPGLVKAARREAVVVRVFDSRRPVLHLIAREMRLHQWMKNLLVFVPLATSHQLAHWLSLGKAAVAFLAFGLVASSVYILNDVFDLQSDRDHHRKRLRPFASGDLALPWAFLLAPSLWIAGFGLVALLIPRALAVLLLYYALTVLYSYWLKRKLLLDVFVLATLYTIRIVVGAAAYHVDLSVWLLSFSMFLFLSLGFAKRSAELHTMGAVGGAPNSRRAYRATDLYQINTFGIAAGFASSLVLTLYMNSDNIRILYRHPDVLWLLFPLVLYWISRIWIITSRGEMDEDPVLFAIRDRTTMLVLVASILVMFLATTSFVT